MSPRKLKSVLSHRAQVEVWYNLQRIFSSHSLCSSQGWEVEVQKVHLLLAKINIFVSKCFLVSCSSSKNNLYGGNLRMIVEWHQRSVHLSIRLFLMKSARLQKVYKEMSSRKYFPSSNYLILGFSFYRFYCTVVFHYL